MSKYKLHFSELNSTLDVECLEFTSAKKRSSFIADRVIANNPIRVFTLIVNYNEDRKYSDVYVFENWSCIQDVVNSKWTEFWLFEWESYSDAYKNALDLKETNPLCYS